MTRNGRRRDCLTFPDRQKNIYDKVLSDTEWPAQRLPYLSSQREENIYGKVLSDTEWPAQRLPHYSFWLTKKENDTAMAGKTALGAGTLVF